MGQVIVKCVWCGYQSIREEKDRDKPCKECEAGVEVIGYELEKEGKCVYIIDIKEVT